MEEKMCKYCDPDSNERRVFNVCFSDTYYLSTETFERDYKNGGYIKIKTYINYCPWCGRKLNMKADESEKQIMEICRKASDSRDFDPNMEGDESEKQIMEIRRKASDSRSFDTNIAYDYCDECEAYGNDYTENEDGDLICNCDTCPYNPLAEDDYD